MCHCRDFDWCKFADLHRNILCIGDYVEARWCHGQVCVHSSKYILLFMQIHCVVHFGRSFTVQKCASCTCARVRVRLRWRRCVCAGVFVRLWREGPFLGLWLHVYDVCV